MAAQQRFLIAIRESRRRPTTQAPRTHAMLAENALHLRLSTTAFDRELSCLLP
jgi:hypothetical protein